MTVLAEHDTDAPGAARALAVVLVVAVLARAVALWGFEGLIHDGTTRVLTAMSWMSGGRPIFGRTNWPEGNYLLPALALWVWREPYWSVRVLYAAIGVTNVWLVYHLGRTVMGARAGLVAAWVVALMPFHIMMSADAATSEIPYISLMLVSLLASARYGRRPSPWLAAASGLALTASCLFRIDGIIWGLPLAGTLAWSGARQGMRWPTICRDLLIFGGCGLLYPVALLAKWASLYPDPLHIIGQAKLNSQQFFVNGKHPRWPEWAYQSYVVLFWPASMLILMTPVVAILGWTGAISATRRRNLAALPVVVGAVVVLAWLARTAWKHDILAQWRYVLLFVVILSIFCLRGAELAVQAVKGLTLRRVALVAAAAAVLVQSTITYVTFVESGVFTRQLGLLSPIRPDQFGSRDLLDWIRAHPTTNGPVLLTPHAMEQPYLSLHRARLEADGQILVQSYYLPRSELVHTKRSLTAELVEKLPHAGYLVTSASLRELGLRDGLTRELVQPVRQPDGTFEWNGVRLQFIRRFGSNLLWRVLYP